MICWVDRKQMFNELARKILNLLFPFCSLDEDLNLTLHNLSLHALFYPLQQQEHPLQLSTLLTPAARTEIAMLCQCLLPLERS